MTTPTAHEENASRGVHLASDMIAALSRDDEAEAMLLINTADDYTVRYACGYLLRGFLTVLTDTAGGDVVRARELMRACAEGASEDAVDAAVQSILHDARRDEGIV